MPNRRAAARVLVVTGLSDSYTAARVGLIDRSKLGPICFGVVGPKRAICRPSPHMRLGLRMALGLDECHLIGPMGALEE